MLEELVKLFSEAGLEGTEDPREKLMKVAMATRRFGQAAIFSAALQPGGQQWFKDFAPDAVIQLPYFHQAAALLVQAKEKIQVRFGPSLLQVYMLLLASAAQKGQSPNAIAKAMVARLERDAP